MTSVPSASTVLGLLAGASSTGTPVAPGLAGAATDGADAFASELVTSLQEAASQPQAVTHQFSPPSSGAAPATGSDPNATPAGALADLAPAGPQGAHALPATPTPSSTATGSPVPQGTSSGAPVVFADLNESVDTTGPAVPKATGRHVAATHPGSDQATNQAPTNQAAAAPSQALTSQLSVPGPVPAVTSAAASVGAPPVPAALDTGADAADAATESERPTRSIDSTTPISGSLSARPVSARSHLGAASAGSPAPMNTTQASAASTPTVTIDAVAVAQSAGIQTGAEQTKHPSPAQDSSNTSSATAPITATTAPAAPAPITLAATAAPVAAAPVPLQQQISQPILSLKTAPAGTHVLTIRVAPEAIGPVTVRAHISAGSLRVELIAPNSDSTSALKAILPDLGRDLAQGGMNAILSLHQHSADTASGFAGSGQSSSGQSSSSQSAAGQSSSGQSGNAAGFGGRDSAETETVLRPDAPSAPPAVVASSQSSEKSLDVLA